MAEAPVAPTHGWGAVLAATKLHVPAVRPELLARQALLDELASSAWRKITLIEAPAGYGKTTLLAEWCSSLGREVAWLSLDDADSDPVRFWTGVVDALRTVEPGIGEQALQALEARRLDVREVALPLLLNELARRELDAILVLDDYHTVHGEDVHSSVDFLLERLPEGLHVAIATRTAPQLSLARLRARGEMTEIRAADLRFSEAETGELLRRSVGLDLSDGDVYRLHERTEGWPAGLYLAGLSLRDRDNPGEFIESFAGDDRHIVDYLSSEVLADQPAELSSFLMRTSVLQRLCGPLCDAVAETEDSGRLLERIEDRNLFLIPLDTTRSWYRYHRLFGELLRHELHLGDPAAERELHRRACRWYREEGSVADAIYHATAAADIAQAGELIALNWNDQFNLGRLATVERWLDAMPRPAVTVDVRLCVARAWLSLDRGRLDEAREWIELGARAEAEGDNGRSPGPDVGVLRAVHGFKVADLQGAKAAALEVLEAGEEDSFPHTVAQLILGITLHWSGELDEATDVLRRAVDDAQAGGNELGSSYALGYLGLGAVDRRRADEADRLGTEAIEVSDSPGFAEHFVLMIGHLARGRAAEIGGRLHEAEEDTRRAVELSARGAGRLEAAAALLAHARVRHLSGEADEARAVIRDARAVLDRCAEQGTLARELETAERGLRVSTRRVRPASTVAEDLTERELAVLRLLASDLSRNEIARALYVSPNTVKTHAKGIYRKLDASKREDAVNRARELGLI